VLETLLSPAANDRLPEAELLSVAVAAESRGRGVGRALVTAANDELGRRGVDNTRVVVSAGNKPAIALYRSAGFRPAASIEVHAGARSEVLTWS
jgi:ribosomal protein S18 acetylase RimI-like enzyme